MKTIFGQKPVALLCWPCLFPMFLGGQEVKIAVEANQVAVADGLYVDDVFGALGENQSIPGLQDLLVYLAFDLTTLPEGAVVVSAEVNVFDWNPVDAEVVAMTFVDVPADFDPETLTYELAEASYGAAPISDQENPVVGLQPAVVRWTGSALMDNTDPPGAATVGSRRTFEASGTYSDEDLVAALNADLSEGDGKVTFAYHGHSLADNSLIGINYPDAEAGPTLQLTVAVPSGAGPTTTYNFDTRTLEGWGNLTASSLPNGPTGHGVISEDDPAVGNSVPPLPQSSPSFIGPVPFEAEDGGNTRDGSHETLVLRSPEFRIYPNGALSFSLIGGSHPDLDLAEVNRNGLPAQSSGAGAIGFALRRVSDGQYLGFWGRSEDGSTSWETITVEGPELAELVAGEECYTLDFIDSYHGAWAWAGFDDVVIREGVPTVSYDFEDGTLQGWTSVQTSTTADGPTEYAVIDTTAEPVGNSAYPVANSPPYVLGPVPFEAESGDNTRDRAHSTLLLRSPEFALHGNGAISFAVLGGTKPALDLAEVNANGLPASSSPDGALGVALRRVSDGRYLGFWSRTIEEGSQFWETVTVEGDELTGLVEDGELYTLDLIDSNHGSWAWACYDNVTISQGSPGAAFDFDDRTLQGWVNVTNSATVNGPTHLGILSNDDPNVGNSVPPFANSAPSFVGPLPFEAEDNTNTRDQAHETLILRSPEFTLYPNGALSFSLIGGAHGEFNFDEINANGLPANSIPDGDGVIGFGLRRVSDGSYLTFSSRTESGGDFWEVVSLDSVDLRGKVASGGEVVTLDFIDSRHGGWGWGGFDDVSVSYGTALPSKGEEPFIDVVQGENGEIEVYFEGTLQVSEDLSGTWTTLTDATSPYTLSSSESTLRFARAVK
ncbi:hypothetical protein AAFN60_20900 [Roseibacillus persicicus]|uniref:hypothetical protein n=1 Tax=Roseibacillus persicicus TaxID=454148 RepID=UPI00398A6BD3